MLRSGVVSLMLQYWAASNRDIYTVLESFKKQGRNDNLDYLGALRSVRRLTSYSATTAHTID